MCARSVAAHHAKCFRHRSNFDVNFPFEMEMVNDSTPVISQDSLAMRIIDHGDGVVFLRELHNTRKRSNVTIHAEDTVRDNQLGALILLMLLEFLFQACHITMLEGYDLRLAQSASIDDAGMVQLVAEDKVPVMNQCRNRAGICRQASLVHQNVLDVFELRQLLLAFDDQARIADDRLDCTRAYAELIDGLLGGFLDILAGNDAQIVVGSKVHDVLAIDRACWTLFRIEFSYLETQAFLLEPVKLGLHHPLEPLVHSATSPRSAERPCRRSRRPWRPCLSASLQTSVDA